MQSYRIILEYTTANDEMTSPDTWDWHDLVAPNVDEALSVVSVEDIETPEGHKEDLAEYILDELAEISQKHNMGY